jgi:hypothetical protein
MDDGSKNVVGRCLKANHLALQDLVEGEEGRRGGREG